jgi:hypothetical protein
MPFTNVMPQFKSGHLHSGSKSGPTVKNPKQAVAIMLSEKRAAKGGKKEYGDAADSPGQDENQDGVYGGKAPKRPGPTSLSFKGLEQAAKKK